MSKKWKAETNLETTGLGTLRRECKNIFYTYWWIPKVFLRKNASWNHEHFQRVVELLSQCSAKVKTQATPVKWDKKHRTSSITVSLHKICPAYLTTGYTSGHPTLKPTHQEKAKRGGNSWSETWNVRRNWNF